MRTTRHTIWIDRPREQVFAFFTDFSQASRWRQYVQSMTPVGPRPLGVGSTIHTVIELNGARQEFDLEVLTFDPPSVWRHRTFESDFSGFIEYRFDTEGKGTRVTLTISAKPTSLYGWLAMPIMLLHRNRSYTEQLPQLKSALEGGV